jgi:hypothetical protein
MITTATQPLTYNTVNTTSASTITLTAPPNNSAIYSSTAVTAGGLGSITTGSPYTITGSSVSAPTSTITIGEHEINEGTIGDLLVLLQVIKELDDSNPIKEMFSTIKMLNKIKGKK